MQQLRTIIIIISLALSLVWVGCSKKEDKLPVMFETRTSAETGLNFTNTLSYNPAFNLFKYMYFYNGSGVGAADFNNDGLIDLFFGSNQQQNKLYLNTGHIRFKDVTAQAGIPQDGGWSTGISVLDINNDGLTDIYVCRVGQYETLHSRNQLLINQGVDQQGIPHFVDKAKEYGLDFSGFSTQAAFIDYDNDGDLDLFLLNHSVHQNNNFRPRAVFNGTYDSLSGDRIFRNNTPLANGSKTVITPFDDVTKQTGINSTSISYGLGVVVGDANLDGYPDLYIGNDFHENDYLYINQHNGTFKEEGTHQLMHTSQYSMGVDMADVNNDAQPEIISMDMLPSDPYILKRSLGEDTYDLFNDKIKMGYSYQYTRNNLQYNQGNGSFSETGLYSGIAATDWSWAALWMDFDNDGLKDLFISNGIPKRMNDIDYVNFVSNNEVQQKISNDDMQGKDLSLISKFPEIKIPNKFYRNNGDLTFQDEEQRVAGNAPTFSNGAVYADLDNDGDLDIVVNNIDNPVLVYENMASDSVRKASLKMKINGAPQNRNAIGAKVILFSGSEVRTYENYAVRGFLSSMQMPLNIGLSHTAIDSMFIIWPDRTFEPIGYKGKDSLITLNYRKGLPLFDFRRLEKKHNSTAAVADITKGMGLNFVHAENHFVEFDREPLIPHMVSTEGPAIAVADINKDGLDDVFMGAARDFKSAVFIQQVAGRFIKLAQPALDADSMYENTDAAWADVNNDGNVDLLVASGGNEFYGADHHNTPRIYLNDGKGHLTNLANPFGETFLTASCIVPYDVNGDGYTDLFIGGRVVPWAYGETPQSYLFINNKNGTFTNATERYAKDLGNIGMVTNALWFDLDKDGDKDLLLSLEWGGIVAFVNNNGNLNKKVLCPEKGWWNFVLPCDVDGDGKIDLVAGNLGLNTRLKATAEKPVRLYFNDFDNNGRKEQVLTYYVGDKEIAFATKAELEKQMPVLKKNFLYAADFAKASLGDIFGQDKLEASQVLTANYFSNAVLMNKGNWTFQIKPLPWQAQLTSFKDAVVTDANNDGKPDILLMGNYYDNNIEMGRYDADYGTVLLNTGKGNFEYSNLNGLSMKGQVRHIKPIAINKRQAYILAKNNDTTAVIRFGGLVK